MPSVSAKPSRHVDAAQHSTDGTDTPTQHSTAHMVPMMCLRHNALHLLSYRLPAN